VPVRVQCHAAGGVPGHNLRCFARRSHDTKSDFSGRRRPAPPDCWRPRPLPGDGHRPFHEAPATRRSSTGAKDPYFTTSRTRFRTTIRTPTSPPDAGPTPAGYRPLLRAKQGFIHAARSSQRTGAQTSVPRSSSGYSALGGNGGGAVNLAPGQSSYRPSRGSALRAPDAIFTRWTRGRLAHVPFPARPASAAPASGSRPIARTRATGSRGRPASALCLQQQVQTAPYLYRERHGVRAWTRRRC